MMCTVCSQLDLRRACLGDNEMLNAVNYDCFPIYAQNK